MSKLKSVGLILITFEMCARNERWQLKYRSLGRHKVRMTVTFLEYFRIDCQNNGLKLTVSNWVLQFFPFFCFRSIVKWPSYSDVHNFLSNSQRYLQFGQYYDKRLYSKTMQIFDCTSDVLLPCVVLSTRLFTLFSAFNFVPRALFPGKGRAFDGKFALGRDFFRFIEEVAFSFPELEN